MNMSNPLHELLRDTGALLAAIERCFDYAQEPMKPMELTQQVQRLTQRVEVIANQMMVDQFSQSRGRSGRLDASR